MPYPTLPNPANPRAVTPVEIITDRAKRYRAHKNPPPPPLICGFCASRNNIDLEHIDGNEGNDADHNKMWLCRRCNAKKGSHFARNGHGIKTRQYNPENPARQPSFLEYGRAALVLRGDIPGSVPQAVRTMQNTTHETRAGYVRLLRKLPNPGAKTLKEYVEACLIHDRKNKAHDAGGLIIHLTPKARRRRFASEIWSRRKKAAKGRKSSQQQSYL